MPLYETELIRGARSQIETGDKITIIGGGWGVSTVVAAQEAGEEGKVVTYEGATKQVKRTQQTLLLNDTLAEVSIIHAVVGKTKNLRGDAGRPEQINPDQLSPCDGLIMDCEGAEMDILTDLRIRPRFIVVETHGLYDAPTEKVKEKLVEMEYEIAASGVAEEWKKEDCYENDVYVLTAVKEETSENKS
ncbi:FkbM family methyltransferase [Halorussus sp. MSC15.2]|uniref:FkbM family methyltransferase n=1 Tax=Halorussus sp. MSC15.2 TaxID=2283638 RepID=UPI0013D19DAC|nr:FkbM family methyltransferase [Halorussus sp. MSC15.2]NEU55651.1 FkbM family methyltransferase [Halorussus sp. MSC15.2]